jgi:hypothetical protein
MNLLSRSATHRPIRTYTPISYRKTRLLEVSNFVQSLIEPGWYGRLPF